MKFILHQAVLDGPDDTLDRIDRIVDRVADEVHEIALPDADLLEVSRWYGSARQTRRKLVKTAVAGPVRASGQTGSLHSKTAAVRTAPEVEVAEKLAHSPLTLLVENRESDGVLLEILIEECGSPSLTRFWTSSQRCSPRAVEIVTAGGVGEIPARIERAVQDAAIEGRPIRMVVVCDSDARWPGDQSHSSVSALRNVLATSATHQIPLHILAKRCAENYIPDEVFIALRDDRSNSSKVERYNALLRRSTIQRDHLPIKDGLGAGERDEGSAQGHYGTQDQADLVLLSGRLFDKRPRPMRLLKDERRGAFTVRGLQARDGKGEIEALLNLIASEV